MTPLDELWEIPDWVVLWPGSPDFTLFNSLNLAIVRLDKDAAALITALRQAGPVCGSTANAQGLSISDMDLLVQQGFLVPQGQNTRQYLKQTVEASRRAVSRTVASHKIRSARLVLTQACNLQCDYCFVPAHTVQSMSADTALRAVKGLVRASGGYLEHLQFFGGEPLLRYALIQQVVHYLEQEARAGRVHHVRYAITTNGTLLTKEMAQFFQRHGFFIDVSLDGTQPIHDRHRRTKGDQGSFDSAVRGLRLLRESGVDAGVIVTPTDESITELPSFVEYAIRQLGARSISINTPQPSSKGWPVNGDLFAEQIVSAMSISEASGVPFTSALGRVRAVIGSGQPYYFSCLRDTGSLGVSISPDGKVSPCDVAWDPEIAVGTVESLGEELPLDTWKLLPHSLPESCFECFALATCGGPCPLDLYYNADDARTNLNRCQFYRATTRWAAGNLPSQS